MRPEWSPVASVVGVHMAMQRTSCLQQEIAGPDAMADMIFSMSASGACCLRSAVRMNPDRNRGQECKEGAMSRIR